MPSEFSKQETLYFVPGFPRAARSIRDFPLASLHYGYLGAGPRPCFAWYTVEVIRSLDIGILIYVTIDRPVPLSPLPPSWFFSVLLPRPSIHDLPALNPRGTSFRSFEKWNAQNENLPSLATYTYIFRTRVFDFKSQ